MTKKATSVSHTLVWVQFGSLAWLFLLSGVGLRSSGTMLLEAAGLAIVFWAVVTMRRNFRVYPEVREGNRLVLSGPFQYVRHPVYTGMLLIGLAWASIAASSFAMLLWAVLLVDLIVKIDREEVSLIEQFGDQYRDFQKKTKRLIPLIY